MFVPIVGRDKRIRDSLNRLESALTLVGATGVEDRLQEAVPRTVRALLDAGIIVWVLTGDKPETAINIAYSAALFSQSDQLLYLMSRDKVSSSLSLRQERLKLTKKFFIVVATISLFTIPIYTMMTFIIHTIELQKI